MRNEYKRRTEIWIETHEITTIRVIDSSVVTAYCEICRSNAVYVPVSDAAAAFRMSEMAILALAKTGELHVIKGHSNESFICTHTLGSVFLGEPTK